jgi:hypothetical protein
MKEAVYGVAPIRRAPGLEFAESLVQRRITPRVRESFPEECVLEVHLDHGNLRAPESPLSFVGSQDSGFAV